MGIRTALDDQLKKEGWGLYHIIHQGERASEDFSRIALELSRGIYTSYRIIPGDVVMEGEGWMPCEPVHFFYAKLKSQYRPRERTVRIAHLLCRDPESGEERDLPFSLVPTVKK